MSANTLPETGPGSRRRRLYFLAGSGILVLAVVIAFEGVLLPFALAIVLAYVLAPIVEAGERIRIADRNLPRWVVVLFVYILLIGLLSALLSLAVPRLVVEISKLTQEAPRAVNTIRDQWLPQIEETLRNATAPYLEKQDVEEESPQTDRSQQGDKPLGIKVLPVEEGGYDIVLPKQGLRVTKEGDNEYRIGTQGYHESPKMDINAAITDAVSRTLQNTEKTTVTLLQTAQKVAQALVRGVFGFFLMLMISAYLLITSNRIFEFFRSLYPIYRRVEFDDLISRIDRGLAGVVRGQLLICVVNGALSGIGFYLLDLRYWSFLTLIATLLSIIPIFGAILSSVPAVLIAMSDGFGLALAVLAWIVVIHQIEANLLNPKIMGDAARVHPVLVIFALLAGEHVGGIVGALLAVPVLSITQSLFLFLREHALGVPRVSSIPPSHRSG